jgi:hypothetical protein
MDVYYVNAYMRTRRVMYAQYMHILFYWKC